MAGRRRRFTASLLMMIRRYLSLDVISFPHASASAAALSHAAASRVVLATSRASGEDGDVRRFLLMSSEPGDAYAGD